MMRPLLLLVAVAALSCVHGWTALQYTTRSSTTSRLVGRLAMSSSSVPVDDDPCWQDLYDDDCSMSSVYAASFVAGKWIKSMPCAKGLDEDCDMGDLDVPNARPEGGVGEVDVMGFLGLKKAEPVSKEKFDENEATP